MHFISHLIHAYGLLTVAAIVGLECVGLPLPGEAALLAAAMYAGTKHDLNIISIILTASGAAIVGRTIGYVIGYEFHWLLQRFGNYVRMTESRIKLGEYLFLRHGSKIVAVAQFVPVLRMPALMSCRGAIFCSPMWPDRSCGRQLTATRPTLSGGSSSACRHRS
jgi:membrane protein DedA with SNARE-associated domain